MIRHCNVRSLLSSSTVDEISHLLEDHAIDILALSETWMDSNIPDHFLIVSGYLIFRNDRNRNGGGILVYVSDKLTVRQLSLCENDNTESLWLSVSYCNKNIVASYYQPPG